MDPFYLMLFILLVLECIIFILVSIIPKQLQKYIVCKFTKSAKMSAFWKAHIIFCIILAIFFVDLHMTGKHYEN